MPEQDDMLQSGLIPMGCTPHLLFTFGCPAEVDENNIPLGPTMIVHHPDLYLLVRDILMEQQTLLGAQDAADRCLEAIMKHIPKGKDIFDIEAHYKGPTKTPPHDKESTSEPPQKETDSPKV